VIIKYLFSHSLRCNIECTYICKFLYDNVAAELVFGLGWMVILSYVTWWQLAEHVQEHSIMRPVARLVSVKRRSWCAWLCTSKYYLCL